MAEQPPSQRDPAESTDEAQVQQSAPGSADPASSPSSDPGPGAGAEQALQAADEAVQKLKAHAIGDAADSANSKGHSLDLQELRPAENHRHACANLGLLDDIDLNVKVELGRTLMYVEDVLRLNENSVIELDKAAGDPVDIYVNDRHVARGEVLVLNENFCVRISEIIKHEAGTDETGGHG